MDSARIASLLAPFLPALGLSPLQLGQVAAHLDLLLRWNWAPGKRGGINLTSVRAPEEIITRHFGESFFLASRLFLTSYPAAGDAVDIGSGAGFPGIPLKIYLPTLPVTLIESNHKKAAFLQEVVRATTLTDINVFRGRLQEFAARMASADSAASGVQLVTLRALERFQQALPAAASLVATGGLFALLIGAPQCDLAQRTLPGFFWQPPLAVPLSRSRVLLIGARS